MPSALVRQDLFIFAHLKSIELKKSICMKFGKIVWVINKKFFRPILHYTTVITSRCQQVEHDINWCLCWILYRLFYPNSIDRGTDMMKYYDDCWTTGVMSALIAVITLPRSKWTRLLCKLEFSRSLKRSDRPRSNPWIDGWFTKLTASHFSSSLQPQATSYLLSSNVIRNYPIFLFNKYFCQ